MTVELMCGDCLTLMRDIPSGSVDALITDPPYGIGADKANAHSSIRDNDKWPDATWDIRPTTETIKAIIAIAPITIIWGGNYFGLDGQSKWLVWNKPGRGFSLADAELAWTNLGGAVRSIYLPRNGFERTHPTQKPLELMLWCLSFLPEHATILDPFMGSGTTGVACVQTGRNFTGIEIDEGYFNIASKRIAEAQLQVRMAI